MDSINKGLIAVPANLIKAVANKLTNDKGPIVGSMMTMEIDVNKKIDGSKKKKTKNQDKKQNAQNKPKNTTGKINKGISRSQRSGLLFPVTRVSNHLKKKFGIQKISKSAGPFLTSVLEYFVYEVLESVVNHIDEKKKKRITPRHIELTIREDQDLAIMFKNVSISKGGVIPHIEESLLPNSKKKKQNQENQF